MHEQPCDANVWSCYAAQKVCIKKHGIDIRASYAIVLVQTLAVAPAPQGHQRDDDQQLVRCHADEDLNYCGGQPLALPCWHCQKV